MIGRHHLHPVVVPRTFTGAFVLSSIAKLISLIIPKQIFILPSHPMAVQFLIRLELLFFSWMSHVRLSKALGKYVGDQLKSPSDSNMAVSIPSVISNYYLLITASQFHLPFYSSRLLPNTFALILVTNAYAEWFNNNPRRTAMFLVFTTAVFRCDVLLILGTVGLTMLLRRQISILQAIVTGALTGVVSLVLTGPLDSLLWGRPIWPEFEVWWFNAVDNRSSEWGTMPYHWYFSTALPKGMLLTALLVPLAFARLPEFICNKSKQYFGMHKNAMQTKEQRSNGMIDTCLMPFFVPVLGFIMLFSFLPHKEIRFIFTAFPMFNACAAYGLSRLHQVTFSDMNESNSKRKTTQIPFWISRVMYLCGVAAVSFTMLGSAIFVRLSNANYPGGVALERLRLHLDASISQSPTTSKSPKWEDVHVHVDVAAAMTGVSLFGQRHASHRYLNGGGVLEGPFLIEKSGYEEENTVKGTSSAVFSHLLSEQQHVKGYHIIDTIQGQPRLDIRNFRIDSQDAIYIWEKDGWL